jgi:hypothetical protein
MPNHDGGHYFLTVLAPIRVELTKGPVVGWSRSHRQRLAQKLALLATGRQTEASPADAWHSPFSRNTLNHLARFVIIDGPNYNGRLSGDTLIGRIRKLNPLIPQPVDTLSTPFLLFAADIDAVGEDGEAALRAYTRTLWETAETDLKQIFDHCCGFEGITTADGFHDYIKRCQLETTMPFNDYWADGLDVGNAKFPTMPLVLTGGAAVLAIVVWLLALLLNGLLTVANVDNGFSRAMAHVTAWGTIIVPILVGLVLLAALGLLRWIGSKSRKPFPTAPGSDLPTVLKSLFLQQQFTRFATEAQGLDDAQLHARFGRFLAAVQPSAPAPTQAPGEVRAKAVEWAR